MIAADTSSLIAFFAGERSGDVNETRAALQEGNLVIPPVVLMEVLSDPLARNNIIDFIQAIPVLELSEGYWVRAASIRQRILREGLKSRLADALIAQSCIDHNIPLITRDKDFRHYVKHCGLKLYESQG